MNTRIGLALSGGGVKGFFHVGVLKFLEERGIRPSVIAGTSAGSIVGSLYADGYTPEEIASMFTTSSALEILNFSSQDKVKRAMQGLSLSALGLTLGVSGIFSGELSSDGGLLSIDGLGKFLEDKYRHKRFEDLPIRTKIVATDLDRGQTVVFTQGSIAPRVEASCAVPILFAPVRLDGVAYVDGGLMRNFPASVIRQECDFLIGVNLGSRICEPAGRSIYGVAMRSWDIIFKQNMLQDRRQCDFLIEIEDIPSSSVLNQSEIEQLVRHGYRTAELAFARLESNSRRMLSR